MKYKLILLGLTFILITCASLFGSVNSEPTYVERGEEFFDPGPGQIQKERLTADDALSRVILDIEVKKANLHDEWGSAVQVILGDKSNESRIIFRIIHSGKRKGKTAVRVNIDGESEKAHYLDEIGERDYVGKHRLILTIDENSVMHFEANGVLIEKHEKKFEIENAIVSAVGTNANVLWIFEYND